MIGTVGLYRTDTDAIEGLGRVFESFDKFLLWNNLCRLPFACVSQFLL